MGSSFFFASVLTLCVAGCGSEAPRARTPGPHSAPPNESAIPAISPSAAPSASSSRFDTRRIGASAPPVERDHAGGRAIDLDVRDADLHDVLRLLADVGGVGIVVPGDITGRVTITLHRVPWRQALETIVAAKGLGVERAGNVFYVTRP